MQIYTFSRSIADYSYISNFVLYDDQRQVLFAVRGVVYGIRIDRQTARPYSSLDDVSCNRLQYAGNHIFYAYCASGEAKVYNTDQEEFRNAGLAIPYACPSSSAETPSTLFQVQQTHQGTVVYHDSLDYNTTGLNFTNGECYDGDTFFLLDSVEGTKLFRQSLGTFQVISESSRDRNLVVFNGPYVVVYRTGPTEVVLYDPLFQVVVNLFVEMPVAVGVVTNIEMQPQASSATSTATLTSATIVSPTKATPPPTRSPVLTTLATAVPSATTPPILPSTLPRATKVAGWVGGGVAIAIIIAFFLFLAVLLW